MKEMLPPATLYARDRMSYDDPAALLWIGGDGQVEGVG